MKKKNHKKFPIELNTEELNLFVTVQMAVCLKIPPDAAPQRLSCCTVEQSQSSLKKM